MPAPKRPNLSPEGKESELCRGGRKMEIVYQEGKNAKGVKGEEGCAIACVAMLTGMSSYAESKERTPAHWEPRGAEIEEIRSVLISLGFECDPPQPIEPEGFRTFDFDAVLYGKQAGRYEHVAVWDGCERKMLDPYKPGGNFKCISYFRVHTEPKAGK